ncbi:YhdP family protein [Chitinimonas sp.]|uniref:YhdP family protein n=1 Tax=Chitinimonas sp. TaxID=1934313 RepID=UPI0035B18C5F
MSPASRFPLRARLVWLRRKCLRLMDWHGRVLVWAAALFMLVWGGAAAWLQWWFFPHLESYRPKLVATLSERAGRPVEIGSVQGGWRLGQPYLAFDDLALKHQDGRAALSLKRAEATLSWWPLLIGDIRFEALAAIRPDLEITREADGTIRLADLPLNRSNSPDNGFGNWLLRQHAISIVDGRLTWRDHQRQAPDLKLDHVSFSMENRLFGRHQFALAATPPPTLAAPFSVDGHWSGDEVDHFADWDGTVQGKLADVDLAAGKAWLPYPVDIARGRGQLALALDFQGMQLRKLDASLDINGAALRLAPELETLALQALSGTIHWQDKGGERSLDLSKLRLVADGGKLLDGTSARLKLGRKGGGSFEAEGLTLPALANLPPALPLPNALRSALAGMRPGGRIDSLKADWQGDWREPSSYRARMGFTGLSLSAPAPMPTLGPLSGELAVNEAGGNLRVQSTAFHFVDSEVLEKPLQLDQLRAALDWQRNGKAWTVRLNEFAASNADVAATASANWQWAGSGSGNLSLDATVQRLAADKVADYLPNGIGKETREWLRAALLGGEARDAKFTLRGPLDKFPFDDGKSGTWRVVTQLHDVMLDYAVNWPRVEGINGELRIEGDKLQLASNGRILGTRIERATAAIPNLSHAKSVLIDGQVRGATSEFFRFVALSPLDHTLGGIGTAARSTGDASLALKLDVPFDNADDTRVDGTLKFARNRLQLSDAMPELRELSGSLHFNEHGADARGLIAQALGGALKVDVSTGKDGVLQVQASGRADARAAAQRYDIPLSESLSGQTDYRMQLNIPRSGWQMALEAPMRDVRIDLPAPLTKPAGEVRPLKLALEADAASERWRIALGSQLNAQMLRTLQGGSWRTSKGELRLGEGSASASRNGIWITGSLPSFNADAWLDRLDAPASAPAGAASPVQALGLAQISGVDARLGRLLLAGNRIDDLNLQALQSDGSWQISASSAQIDGRATWSPQGRERLFARLGKLKLPLPDAEIAGPASPLPASKRRLPAVDLMADDFQLNNHPLGKLEVKAQPNRDSWLIDALTVVNADGKLSMQGSWSSLPEDDHTTVKVDVESSDVGKLLARFGYPELMRRGKGSIHGDLSWHGSPLSPEYASLSGNLKVVAESGQFAKVDPGVGRLLGVLSLQSLPRRLTLDFRDIFSEGFAFDRIEGDSKVSKGVLSTSNLTIVGPAAKVSFKGEADLGAETQKLRVRIVPTLGDSLAIGAGVALANPVVGVGAYVLQRVLKDPLGQLVAYEYDITGKWDDPQIVRVGSSASSKPAARQQP